VGGGWGAAESPRQRGGGDAGDGRVFRLPPFPPNPLRSSSARARARARESHAVADCDHAGVIGVKVQQRVRWNLSESLALSGIPPNMEHGAADED